MKRLGVGILALIGVVGCTESRIPTQSRLPESPVFETQQGPGVHRFRQNDGLQQGPYAWPALTGAPTISYHGGPVIFAQKVAVIYWSNRTIYQGGPAPGTTGVGANDGSVVGFFLNNLGGSPHYGINSTYYGSGGTHIQNSVTYTQYWASNTGVPAPGSNVSLTTLENKIKDGIWSGALTWDANTVYLVFTDSLVDQDNMFGSGEACAEHWAFGMPVNRIVKAAAMPRVIDEPGCRPTDVIFGAGSPNNDPAADAEVNVIVHEVEEANTDPQPLSGWYDSQNYENADKCAWEFGSTYATGNGATANVNIGGRDFLIQMNWEFGTHQGCATKFAVATLTVAPNPVSVCLNGASPLGATTLDQIANVWNGGTVAWSSSNPSVAPVTPNGTRQASVAGSAAGQATITATLDGVTGTTAATVGTCLAPPTNCTLQRIPPPANYLKVAWTNGDASASTEVDINRNGIWSTVSTVSPGISSYFYVLGQQTGLFYARVRHVKQGYLASTYCNTGSITV